MSVYITASVEISPALQGDALIMECNKLQNLMDFRKKIPTYMYYRLHHIHT